MDVVITNTQAGTAYVILAAHQGPRGVPGPPGGGISTQPYTARQAISAYTVAAIAGGKAIAADSSQQPMAGNVLGIVIAGAVADAVAVIQYSGEIDYNGWSWTLGKPIFLGIGGALTQIPPVTGFNQIVGTPITATAMLVSLQTPTLIN